MTAVCLLMTHSSKILAFPSYTVLPSIFVSQSIPFPQTRIVYLSSTQRDDMTSAGAAAGYNIYRTTDIVQSNQPVQNEQPRPEDSKCIGVPYPVKPPDKHELLPKQQSEGPFKITERPVEITDGKTKDCDRDRTFGVFLDGQQMPDRNDPERAGRRKRLWAAIKTGCRQVFRKKGSESA
jgi:hypothetical protein